MTLEESTYPLYSLPATITFELPDGINLTDDSELYHLLISRSQQLVRCGEYIKLCSEVCCTCIDMESTIITHGSILQQEEHAILLACVTTGGRQLCIVRNFERVECNGEPVMNDLCCPLLTLSPNMRCVSPICVHAAVSIVHECTTCHFVETHPPCLVERELVPSTHTNLTYKHDWSNNFFCVNIYCMNY